MRIRRACRVHVYIKLIYSWSVHPARRRRTHSITVTVRSAHSMASSSTSESDSLPVSSACKAQRWYESQSRRLNNGGENLPLCTAFRSASPNTKLLPTALHSISTPPSTFLDPPLRCTYTHTIPSQILMVYAKSPIVTCGM